MVYLIYNTNVHIVSQHLYLSSSFWALNCLHNCFSHWHGRPVIEWDVQVTCPFYCHFHLRFAFLRTVGTVETIKIRQLPQSDIYVFVYFYHILFLWYCFYHQSHDYTSRISRFSRRHVPTIRNNRNSFPFKVDRVRWVFLEFTRRLLILA